MSSFRIIEQTKNFRIIEVPDDIISLEDLKGDSYKPEVNPDIPPQQLRLEELHFEKLVEVEGVFGFILERWNPEVDKGWEHVDSCWGFIGAYDPKQEKFNHYIVDELKGQIK